MVRRDAVDRAVHEALQQRLDVALRPERRRHLGVRVVLAHGVVGQHEVVRRHLGRDAHAARLALANQADGAGRRDVGDVNVRARQLGQQDVARHHDVLGRPRLAQESQLGRDQSLVHRPAVRQVLVLGMADDGRAEGQGVFHRAAVDLGVHDALAVVGEGDAPRLGQLGHLGQLLALEAARDGADRVDAHDAFDARLGHDVVRDRAVVVDRIGIRHAGHGREAARGRGARAAGDGLLILVAGLPEMDVDVDQAGTDDLAGGVHDLRALGRLQILSDLRDAAVGREHVGDGVQSVRRIHDAAALDEEAHAAFPPASRKRTAMRTATPLVTWSRMTEYGLSATSGEISTPRLTGPGCMIRTSGRQCLSRSSPSPHTREYSRRVGMKPPVMRSCCRRSIMITSAWAMASSSRWLTLTPISWEAGGSSFCGPATVTVMPILRMPWMLERATRLWVMSPTRVTLSPSRWPFFSRIVRRSSSAWVGCSCAPSPAFTTEHLRCLARSAGPPAALWRTTTTSGLMASMFFAVSRKLSPFSALEPETEKLMTSAESHLPAISKEVRVRVEAS